MNDRFERLTLTYICKPRPHFGAIHIRVFFFHSKSWKYLFFHFRETKTWFCLLEIYKIFLFWFHSQSEIKERLSSSITIWSWILRLFFSLGSIVGSELGFFCWWICWIWTVVKRVFELYCEGCERVGMVHGNIFDKIVLWCVENIVIGCGSVLG